MCKPLQFKGEAHRDEEVSQISVVKLMRRSPFFTRQTAFNLLKNIQVLFSRMLSLTKTPCKKHPSHSINPLREGAPHFLTGGARRGEEEIAVTCEGLGESRPRAGGGGGGLSLPPPGVKQRWPITGPSAPRPKPLSQGFGRRNPGTGGAREKPDRLRAAPPRRPGAPSSTPPRPSLAASTAAARPVEPMGCGLRHRRWGAAAEGWAAARREAGLAAGRGRGLGAPALAGDRARPAGKFCVGGGCVCGGCPARRCRARRPAAMAEGALAGRGSPPSPTPRHRTGGADASH